MQLYQSYPFIFPCTELLILLSEALQVTHLGPPDASFYMHVSQVDAHPII